MKKLTERALSSLLTLGNKVLSIYRLRLPVGILQRSIASRFPLQAKKYLAQITLTEPLVKLREDAQRIGIAFTATASVADKLSWQWQGMLDGCLEYRRETAAFYLRDLRIRRISADSLMEQAALPPTLVERLLQSAFDDYPLYQLDENDLKQAAARLLLKSVRIGKDSVFIEFGLN